MIEFLSGKQVPQKTRPEQGNRMENTSSSFRSTVGDAVRCLVVNAVTFWVPMGVYIGILGLVGKNYGFVM